MQPIWVEAFYEVEVENPDEDAATQRDQAEEAYYNGDYEYLGHTLQDRIDFLERNIKSIEATPEGVPAMNCSGAAPRSSLSAAPPKVIVCIEGGVVQGARSSEDVDVEVFDVDNLKEEGDDEKFKTEEAAYFTLPVAAY
jgi:hypothetical protein